MNLSLFHQSQLDPNPDAEVEALLEVGASFAPLTLFLGGDVSSDPKVLLLALSSVLFAELSAELTTPCSCFASVTFNARASTRCTVLWIP